MDLVKYIRYKASDPIEFKRGKEFTGFFSLVQDLFFSPFCWVFFTQCIVQGLCNSNLLVFFNPYTLIIEEVLQVANRYNTVSLKGGLYKICKVQLVLFLQVVVYKLVVFIFKDFKFDIVINIGYRHNVNSLTLLLLAFVDLLTYIRYTVQCSIVHSGWQRSCSGL